MSDYIIPISVALIALIGTLVGIYYGHRKWRVDRDSARSKQYLADRQATYKDVWDRVEQLNVDGRITEISSDVFSDRLTELNALMLKAAIYIEDADRSLVNEYISAARSFHQAVRASSSEDAHSALGETVAMPTEVLDREMAIRETRDDALRHRETLVERVRTVLAGKD